MSGRHPEKRIRMRVLSADGWSLRSWEDSDASEENKIVAKEVLELRASKRQCKTSWADMPEAGSWEYGREVLFFRLDWLCVVASHQPR